MGGALPSLAHLRRKSTRRGARSVRLLRRASAGEPGPHERWRVAVVRCPMTHTSTELVATRGERLGTSCQQPSADRTKLVLVALDEEERLLPSVTLAARRRRGGSCPPRRAAQPKSRDPRLPPRDRDHRGGVQPGRLGSRCGVASDLAPDLVFEDHRLAGFGMQRLRQAFVDFIRSTEGLLSEVGVQALHVRESRVGPASSSSTRPESSTPRSPVHPSRSRTCRPGRGVPGGGGQCQRWDIYDESQLSDALAYYSRLVIE